jgi:hypothetical protein
MKLNAGPLPPLRFVTTRKRGTWAGWPLPKLHCMGCGKPRHQLVGWGHPDHVIREGGAPLGTTVLFFCARCHTKIARWEDAEYARRIDERNAAAAAAAVRGDVNL